MNHEPSNHDAPPRGFWHSRFAIGLVVLGAIAMYFLQSEHRAHLFGAVPYLLLLACPLMHVFMHRGHKRHDAGPSRHAGGRHDVGPAAAAPSPKTGDGMDTSHLLNYRRGV